MIKARVITTRKARASPVSPYPTSPGSLGHFPANVTSQQRTGCSGGALDDAAARRDDDRRTLCSPRDTVRQRLNRLESHPTGCCTHHTPAPQSGRTPIVLSRIARSPFDGERHMWIFCRDGTMRSGLRPIYQICSALSRKGGDPLEVVTPPADATNRTSRSRMPRGMLTGNGQRGTFLLGLESGRPLEAEPASPGPAPHPIPRLARRSDALRLGLWRRQQVCARHLAPFAQEGKPLTPSGRASGWGKPGLGKIGLVPMKPYRGEPSHLSPHVSPIGADGLGRSHSVPSLGNASPPIISEGRAYLQVKRQLGGRKRGREGGVKECERG